jgi:ornithine cyclodeaminase/alanine dehydrogenase-like protein (mu-crystallin family)
LVNTSARTRPGGAQHIAAELGELPTRRDDREITVFKSLGLAVEDLFAAHLVLARPGHA